jgi:hypothetical protein
MTATRRAGRTAPFWDAPLTVGLLGVGVLNTTQTVAQARDLPAALDAVYTNQGIGHYSQVGLATGIGWVVVVESVLSLVIAIAFSVPRIRAHRVAFWIPLTAAVASSVLTVVLVAVAILADPAYLASVQHSAGTP